MTYLFYSWKFEPLIPLYHFHPLKNIFQLQLTFGIILYRFQVDSTVVRLVPIHVHHLAHP